MGEYDQCVETCKKVIEEGRQRRADYQLIARAFSRMGNAHMKKEEYTEAINAYNKALTEHRTAPTLAALQKAEKLQEEKLKRDYINPEISLQEKEKGNEEFKAGHFPEAIKHYSEAIRRNPSDHVLFSNRAACYQKLGEYPLGIKDCDTCISMNSNFVKAYIRKGLLQTQMKEYHKALETYDKGLKIDP